ncbi:alpha/beta hydrolase [Mycolicibacterium fortuitum]|uniref:Alpha/beta hydrolase n=2 Tax=Mycolicibacterium fortuitum TaxID=1766 RepID=A0AAE5AAN4_MYCFO|nr:alpha/beta hydrolase [Mycolicibacterium fortuitum]MCV7138532.1 alpha/beta-hydrolase family protein [Mycolicibacterium fortuitum]MDV7192439.1 alpha/beta hydrolase [Mycolicibacterium fortuitum]MDV7205263.1 alpha/beta hydrolase [Mycolicibacterium fortuitum]MDV7226844.1 alpha/beta hydrolase [Mycolicibacterium fortuitum]MDV7259350.1 alpha/beta hydrolase [Mycolicibacterium fortuitum]
MTAKTLDERHPVLRWAWGLVRLDFTGIAVGALFFCLSLTPSLLPRDWLFAGLIGGINAAIGYGIGVLLGKGLYRFALRRRAWWPPGNRVLLGLKSVVVIGAIAASILMLIPAAAWQRQVSALMGMEGPATTGYLRTLIIAVAVAAGLIATARLLRDIVRLLARMFIRRWHLHREVAQFIGTAIVVVLVVTLVNGVLYRGFLAGASRVFQPQNSTTREGVSQPSEPERSGSPASFADWDSLGFQGRNFVATGPRAAELEEVNGAPAKEPIRVYAGLHTGDTDDQRIAVLLSELERTHAFDRKLLVIVPTTGTGWVNPVAARALELMYNGDTAMVGMQYSYLPSWISFMGDREKSMNNGRLMIDAIHARWEQLPPEHRPELVLYGESLGSMAGQGAFSWLPDISRMGFSSVLWVGPPNASPLWRGLTVRRDPGTPEVRPRYDNGRTVRFSEAADAAEIAHDAAPPWEGTRVLFLQHPSDPIVWWSTDLLFSEPDWLVEPPGGDRTASMRWYPIITFWQVAADITNASSVPNGHGHNYGESVLDGWAAVAPPPGWTPEDTERIRVALDKTVANDGPEY